MFYIMRYRDTIDRKDMGGEIGWSFAWLAMVSSCYRKWSFQKAGNELDNLKSGVNSLVSRQYSFFEHVFEHSQTLHWSADCGEEQGQIGEW